MAVITPMNEAYLRPRKILDTFSRLYPGAWRQADDFRASRKELGDWPDWCFLPLAGAYAIVSKGTTLKSIDQTRHVGILGALAAWRVTQGIYRFDPTTFEALCETPVTGDIPTEALFRLPEWCVYIPTPDRRWGGDTLHGFFFSPTSNTTRTTDEWSCGSSSTSRNRKVRIWPSCPCTWAKEVSRLGWRR